MNPEAVSRGYLCRNYLLGDEGAGSYVEGLKTTAYNGFNLVCGDVKGETWYATNRGRGGEVRKLEGGVVYGMTNNVMVEGGIEWPKVRRGKELFTKLMKEVCVVSREKSISFTRLIHASSILQTLLLNNSPPF